MDKKIVFLIILGIFIFIVLIFANNFLIKNYRKEIISSGPQIIKEPTLEEQEIPVQEKEKEKLKPIIEEEEPPLDPNQPLIN